MAQAAKTAAQQQRVRVMTMTEEIKKAKQHDLTAGQRDVLERDKARFKHLAAGAHLDEWLQFYDGASIRKNLAMRLSRSNKPEGKAYVQYLRQLYADDGIDIDDKKTMANFTAILWLGDNAERTTILREIRDAMTTGQRSRLNAQLANQRPAASGSGTQEAPGHGSRARADRESKTARGGQAPHHPA
jgi:hypothetical protein